MTTDELKKADRWHAFVGREPECRYLRSDATFCGRPKRDHDVEFMANPDLWPAWPYLPLKRGADIECGFIVEQNPKDAKIVYLGFIFEPKVPMNDPSRQIRYETFEAIVDDGWIVD